MNEQAPSKEQAPTAKELIDSLARFADHNEFCPIASWAPQDEEDFDMPDCSCGLNLLIANANAYSTSESTPARIIPREPTEEMLQAGLYQSSHDSTSADVHSIWVDMWDRAIAEQPLASKPRTASGTVLTTLRDLRHVAEASGRTVSLSADNILDVLAEIEGRDRRIRDLKRIALMCLEAHEMLTRAGIADGDLIDKVGDAIEAMERASQPPAESLCPNCEKDEVGTFTADDWFLYGVEKQFRLVAKDVLFFRCMACGLEFTGEDGERKRLQAVRDHLDRAAATKGSAT